MSVTDILLGLPVELACEIVGKLLSMKDIAHLDSAYCQTSKRNALHKSVFQSPLLLCATYPNSGRELLVVESNTEWSLKKGIRVEIVNLFGNNISAECVEYFRRFGHYVKLLYASEYTIFDRYMLLQAVRFCVNLRMLVFHYYTRSTMIQLLVECKQLEILSLTCTSDMFKQELMSMPSSEILHLKSLRLQCRTFTEAAILRLCKSDALETLHLSIDNSLVQLDRFTNLRTLSFNDSGLMDEHTLSRILQCSSVINLDLSSISILSDAQLGLIVRGLRDLRALSIELVGGITDCGIEKVLSCHATSLERVCTHSCVGVTGEGVNNILRRCVKLHTISFDHTPAVDYVLMHNIRTLIVDFPIQDDVQLTWQKLSANCSTVQHLYVCRPDSSASLWVNTSYMAAAALGMRKLRCVHVAAEQWGDSKYVNTACRNMLPGVRVVAEDFPTWFDIFFMPN